MKTRIACAALVAAAAAAVPASAWACEPAARAQRAYHAAVRAAARTPETVRHHHVVRHHGRR